MQRLHPDGCCRDGDDAPAGRARTRSSDPGPSAAGRHAASEPAVESIPPPLEAAGLKRCGRGWGVFGIIFCDPETVLVPPMITRIPGRFNRTGTDVAVVIL